MPNDTRCEQHDQVLIIVAPKILVCPVCQFDEIERLKTDLKTTNQMLDDEIYYHGAALNREHHLQCTVQDLRDELSGRREEENK